MFQKNASTLLTSWGSPKIYQDATLTAGENGPVLMQDNDFFDDMGHFGRERIPERVVHAKGAGAFGYFEVTNDITQYTAAKVFEKVGKKTPIAVRFSQVAGEAGYPDTVRDPRGFAVKFYTDDGIWDLVGNNTPIFFIRDPILFPSFIHTQKRNPVTHLKDMDAFWDFMSLRPETCHQFLYLFGDRGIPQSYRTMNGYGSHTFKFVNEQGDFVWCKFHYKADLGVRNMDVNVAEQTAGKDPDFLIRDLYNAIAVGNYPVWNMSIQIMTDEQAKQSKYIPFDLTKVWPHKDFPLIPVGRFCLNQNPSNYFSEVEQLAFSPSNFVPGIEPSPDKMLQGRLMSYPDTHKYRLGVNYQQIPVNSPFRADAPTNYERDGHSTIVNQNGAPNYHPNSFSGPEVDPRAQKLQPKFPVSGDAFRYDSGDQDNYSQPRVLYQKVFTDAQKQRAAENIAASLHPAAPFIQKRTVEVWSNVDQDLANGIQQELDKLKETED